MKKYKLGEEISKFWVYFIFYFLFLFGKRVEGQEKGGGERDLGEANPKFDQTRKLRKIYKKKTLKNIYKTRIKKQKKKSKQLKKLKT